jgi:four helix bundle protein
MEDGKSIHFSFQDLKVWQKAIRFSESVIRLIDTIDAPRKHYRLIEQLESASASVALNIAAKAARQPKRSFSFYISPVDRYLRL